jgi:hypothetical protein
MINEALTFLKNHLNEQLQKSSADPVKVVFVKTGGKDKSIFTDNAVNVLVVGIEEEKTLRAADPYTRSSSDRSFRVQPDIRLYLYVLFVAHFNDYPSGLSYLSRIIQHFQKHRVFDHRSETNLNDGIEQLIMELHTLPLTEQYQLWNALRTTLQPSVLYKVKMVVFSDEAAVDIRLIEETDLDVRRWP